MIIIYFVIFQMGPQKKFFVPVNWAERWVAEMVEEGEDRQEGKI